MCSGVGRILDEFVVEVDDGKENDDTEKVEELPLDG